MNKIEEWIKQIEGKNLAYLNGFEVAIKERKDLSNEERRYIEKHIEKEKYMVKYNIPRRSYNE